MTIEIQERWASRKRTEGTRQSAQVGYYVFGTDDDTAAKNALIGAIPATWDGLVFDDADINQMAEDTFECVAKYLDPETKEGRDEEKKAHELQQPEDESEFEFEIGSASQHVTHSLETTGTFTEEGSGSGSGFAVPDFKKAIGVTNEGGKLSIAGVDIDVGAFSFAIKKVFPPEAITEAYIDFLFHLRRKTNNATFFGFDAGEVRFMGGSGKRRKDGNYDLTFRFEASPNVTGITIGDITGISKGGWEYLWVLSQPEEDTIAKTMVLTPKAVYTERVFENDGDYSGIGIGTGLGS
jgi:hypothetical protein